MGPILFNIFISNLFFHATQTKLNAYADGNKIYHSDVDPLVLDRYICNDVEKANQLCSQNGIIVNAKKNQALIIGQTDYKFSFPVKCEIYIFGMTIGNRLNFNSHISTVCNKISNQFKVMLRFRNIISQDRMLKLYKAFILPHLYCSSVWQFRKTRNSEKLEACSFKEQMLPKIKHFQNFVATAQKSTWPIITC